MNGCQKERKTGATLLLIPSLNTPVLVAGTFEKKSGGVSNCLVAEGIESYWTLVLCYTQYTTSSPRARRENQSHHQTSKVWVSGKL